MMTTHALLVPPSQGAAAQPQRKRKQKSKQRHGAGGGGGGVTVDAMAYLDEIKDTYRHEPEVYREFLALMQDFKSGRKTVTQTITRVAVLFCTNTQLYEGFNSFLPPGYGIVPVYSSRGTRTSSRSFSSGSGSRSDDSDREDRLRDRDEEEEEVEVVITTPDGVERRVFR